MAWSLSVRFCSWYTPWFLIHSISIKGYMWETEDPICDQMSIHLENWLRLTRWQSLHLKWFSSFYSSVSKSDDRRGPHNKKNYAHGSGNNSLKWALPDAWKLGWEPSCRMVMPLKWIIAAALAENFAALGRVVWFPAPNDTFGHHSLLSPIDSLQGKLEVKKQTFRATQWF